MKQREEELKAQNLQLDAALNSMSQGLAMFDADERVVIANDRFAEMYGQTPEQVKPGTTLREILDRRIASDLYAGTTTDAILAKMRERLARKKMSHSTAKIEDGRTIVDPIHPRSDGGWVNTHQDITEREILKDRLDAALNNMAQGLAMFDGERDGSSFATTAMPRCTGLKPDQVKPGTMLRQILEYRVANGCGAGKTADEMLESTPESPQRRGRGPVH